MSELIPDINDFWTKDAKEYIEKYGLEIFNEQMVADIAKKIGIKEVPCPYCGKPVFGEKYSFYCKHCGKDFRGDALEEF